MYTLPLSQSFDPDQCGGKAANLARLIQAGFAVPGGFVIPRAALGLFLEDNRLKPAVQVLLDAYPQMDWRARMECYQALCDQVTALPVPVAVRAAVDPAVRDLLAGAPAGLAVRSSGVCEDLQQASFAGVYESFLGVDGAAAFWEGVKRCWCSSWSPQAAAYASKMGLSPLPPDGMAVLVQPVLLARCSGVIFTADPLSGNPWRFVLNATFGLAQKLVDGAAPADRFVLAWDSGEILEKRVVEKPSALLAQKGEIREAALPAAQAAAAALEDEQAGQIGQAALAVDRLFDRRMDIEWAVEGEQLFLLQARPLTALSPFFPHELSAEEAAETWTPYLNSYGTMNPRERLIAPVNWDRWDTELWRHFLEPGDIFPHLLCQERDFNGYRYATKRDWAGSSLDRLQTEQWLDDHEGRLRRGWLEQLEQVHYANQKLDSAMQQAGSAVDWLRHYVEYTRAERHIQAYTWYSPQWMIFTCEYLLKGFFNEVIPSLPHGELIPGLLQGLSCHSVERTIAAQDFGKRIREDFVRAAFANLPLSEVVPFLHRGYPGCRFLSDLWDFCRHFGVEPPAVDSARMIGQDVDGVLLVIKTSLLQVDAGGARDARAVLSQAAERRKQVEAQVRAALRVQRPDQLDRFNKLLDWAQFWTPALDNRKWACTMNVSLRRGELTRQTGEALAAAGLVDHPEHLLLFTLDECSAYAERPDDEALRALYRQRKIDYERNRRLEPLPFLGQPPVPAAPPVQDQKEPLPTPQAQLHAQAIFQGEGIAPGKVRGRARKIANMDAEHYADLLTGEDILICGPASFSAEWRRDYYALFLVVRGMVAVQGAQLHHATQIARECGAPLINLPEDALEQLPDGVMIEMDGQSGTVTVVETG